MTVSCDDMNSIIQDDLDKGETIYPGAVLDIYAYTGKGRVKLHWYFFPDNRIVKTVIIYDNGSKTERIEKTVDGPVASDGITTAGFRRDSIDISGLAEGTYTFTAYTIDKDGHKSIECTSYPTYVYGNTYIRTLSSRAFEKTEMSTSGNLTITWRDAVSRMLYSIVTYMDHRENPDGVATTVDTVFNSTKTTVLPGLKRLKPFTVRTVCLVGSASLGDTVSVVSNHYPSVVEKTILETNGLAELTDEAAGRITKLTFPFGTENSWTLQDLYYFPNLEELEFSALSELPTLPYERNNVTSTVGGGPWTYIASGYMSDNNRSILSDLIASGQIKKVKYTRNTYPRVDDLLTANSDKVQVTWIPAEPLPSDIMMPHNLLVDFRVDDNTRGATVDYKEDGSNVPAAIAAKFNGELKNVYKVTVTGTNSTIAFSLPEGVQFVFDPHGRLQFDAYLETTDPEYSWLKSGISQYAAWNRIMCQRRSRFENFPNTSPYSANNNGAGPTWNVNTELGTWKSTNWALQTVPQEHIRVIEMKMGNSGLWPLPSGQTLTYYIANLRWTHK
jgi:hypothetical protein